MDPKREVPQSADHLTAHLLQQALEGRTHSAKAWIEILQRCESRLRVLAYCRLNDRTRGTVDIDDLLQEVWVAAAHKIHEFEDRGPGSLQRWLAAILNFKLLHADRKAKRVPFPESAMRAMDDDAVGLFAGLSRTQPGVSQNLRNRELEQKVQAAVAKLPDELREAVLLKVYEGLTGREAAEKLGLSETGFSKRFRTALDRIRLTLKQD